MAVLYIFIRTASRPWEAPDKLDIVRSHGDRSVGANNRGTVRISSLREKLQNALSIRNFFFLLAQVKMIALRLYGGENLQENNAPIIITGHYYD